MSLSGKVILLIDDEADLREEVADFLQEQGCEVLQAGDGHSALNILKNRLEQSGHHGVEVIVSDWMMPGLDGPGLLRELRTNEPFGSLPFLIMSGKVTREDLNSLLQLGVDAVLLKPFNLKVLAGKIEEAISRRQEQELSKLFDV